MNALRNKWIWFGAGVVIGAPAIAFAWWLVSPLFIENEVNEEFPYSQNAVIPANITQAEAEMTMETMSKVDTAASESMPDEMAMSETVSISAGSFVDGDSFHKGQGSATIYSLAEGGNLLRLEDFRVTNGPELHVLLAKSSAPEGRSDLESGYTDIGRLKGNVGNQNYVIPDDIDPAEYSSVVIYCVPFKVVFSYARLQPIP